MVEIFRRSGHNRIQNTNSKIKHIQMPCLVQTEALIVEDKGLSLKEWASFWKIQRLCLATNRPCLVKQTGRFVFDENTKTEFLNISNRNLFPQTPFPYLDRMTKPRYVGRMKPLFGQYKYLFENLLKTYACLTLHNKYMSYKTHPLFYQTMHLYLPNRAKQSI